ncbi:MAG TPA: DmsE family decaheme c-type cytochrome [Candidatus Krumholzibacteria bacterium]|nr:DmsE family decaheme c-type cytochrome [Candidatus Krumholzibacteria bacterium]HPD70883.1 DmsE family decaheme c-type cytochrome [Candidatus Krumholzibacteria bacterium]HRY39417.1 DmsE family decaheme c-type cytochrome [Candidatus Krumholzibacteria bacterium]
MRGLICLVGCLAVLLPLRAARGGDYLGRFEVPAGAINAGPDACATCHEDIAAFYEHSPHAPARGLAVPGTGTTACEACHGPGSLHVDGGGDGWILGVEALGRLDAADRAAMCTQCHVDKDLHFATSAHAGTEVSCADCHVDQAHFAAGARPPRDFRNRAEFCLQCHTEEVADFRQPHRHPVLEGDLSCSACHDPHRGIDQASWDGVNSTCLGCHAEIAGPFVFEHNGVDGEACLSCHRPHGSPHDKLLTQDGNGLCLQCHFEMTFAAGDDLQLGGVNHAGLLAGEARCYDCHREIHGSNVSPTLRDQ